MTRRPILLAGAAALAVALCLELFFLGEGFYSISWDEAGRTLDAWQWATRGVPVEPAWLPFHRVCVGLALKLHSDLVLVPRAVTLLFGLASILATGWLAHELFHDRRTTQLALLLAAFLPERVTLTLAPLAEIMFSAVIVATIALFARWMHSQSRRALFGCALLAAVATSIRFEGWIFAAILFAAVALDVVSSPRRAGWTMLLAFGAISFSFIAWWVFASASSTNPVPRVVANARVFSTLEILHRSHLVQFIVTNAVSMNLIGAAAAAYVLLRGTRADRTIVVAAFSPLLIVSAVAIALHASHTGPAWRLIGVWSLLLVPFTAHLLAGALWPRTGRRLLVLGTLVVLAACVLAILRIEWDSGWAFPESDRRAGEYLEAQMRAEPGTKILIESSTFVFLNVQVASQHPAAFVRNSVPTNDTVPPLLPVGGSLREALAGRKVDLLVFRSDDYKRFLDGSGDVARLGQFGVWSIYRRR